MLGLNDGLSLSEKVVWRGLSNDEAVIPGSQNIPNLVSSDPR
jgi:hypothetical protein